MRQPRHAQCAACGTLCIQQHLNARSGQATHGAERRKRAEQAGRAPGRAGLGVVGQVDERQHRAHDVRGLVIVEVERVCVHLRARAGREPGRLSYPNPILAWSSWKWNAYAYTCARAGREPWRAQPRGVSSRFV